jgi:beta-lactamase class A
MMLRDYNERDKRINLLDMQKQTRARRTKYQSSKQNNDKGFLKLIIALVIFGTIAYFGFNFFNGQKNFVSEITQSLAAVTGNDEEKSTPTPSPTPSPTPTPLPKGDKTELITKISTILGNEKDRYGISIIDLETGEEFGINAQQVLPPASIYKAELAMLVMKDIDNGKYTLDTPFLLKQKYKVYATDPMSYYASNKSYKVSQYLDLMIKQSDNTAMTAMEGLVGNNNMPVINARIKADLGVTEFFRDPHEATAQDIARVFKQIHDQSYLSKTSNDYLLDLLEHTASWLQDRIPAGLDLENHPEITVAHKIGYITTGHGVCFADAGIVFGPGDRDYVIAITNQDVSEVTAKTKIPKISKEVYNYFHITNPLD